MFSERFHVGCTNIAVHVRNISKRAGCIDRNNATSPECYVVVLTPGLKPGFQERVANGEVLSAMIKGYGPLSDSGRGNTGDRIHEREELIKIAVDVARERCFRQHDQACTVDRRLLDYGTGPIEVPVELEAGVIAPVDALIVNPEGDEV